MNLNKGSQPWRILVVAWACMAGCIAQVDESDESDESEASGITQEATAAAPIVSAASGRCLDVRHNDRTPGTLLQIYDCHGGQNQSFSFTAAGELRGFGGAVCVEATGSAPGAPVVIANCSGQLKQQWKLNGNGSITGQQSGLCLDVKDASTANRQPVQLWTCHGGSNQRWSTVTADTQAPTPPSGLVLSNLACDAATLTWNAASDNVGVAFYDVFHDGQLMKSVPGSTLTASITAVPGVTWGFFVNARDAAGNVSQASSTVLHTFPPCQVDTQPPTAPSNLTASVSGTTVTLRWSAATDNIAVRAYDIYRDNLKVGSVATTSSTPPDTSFIDSGLSASTGYSYYVVARDAQSNVSGRSNTVAITTGQVCNNAVCSVTQVATDTDIPWGLVTLPDGTILYNQRDVHAVVRLDPSTGSKTTVGNIPNVESTDGEGGLLGLAIAPTFASDHWLYLMHTSPTDNRSAPSCR